MKVSVIIPTYKPQKYLWKCLDSLDNQTLAKDYFEVVLVLNGCKEPYDTQIKEYISKHNDLIINYIQTDEGGVSNARNIGIDVAKGEYVSFIDDDDYVSPKYLQRLLENSSSTVVTMAKPVEIGSYVFIGAHCIIMKGIVIGDRSVIGACSVVTKNIPEGEIWAGDPAVFIKKVPDRI